MRFKLILVSVLPELSDKVLETARSAGATGATIIPARGIGSHDKKTFLGLTIEGPTDVILFLVEEHVTDNILDALISSCRLREPGVGMAIVLPVEAAVGIDSQMKIFKEQARDQYF